MPVLILVLTLINLIAIIVIAIVLVIGFQKQRQALSGHVRKVKKVILYLKENIEKIEVKRPSL